MENGKFSSNLIQSPFSSKVYDKGRRRGISGREWVTSDESMASAKNMCKNISNNFDKLFETWKPRPKFHFSKIDELPIKTLTHKLVY